MTRVMFEILSFIGALIGFPLDLFLWCCFPLSVRVCIYQAYHMCVCIMYLCLYICIYIYLYIQVV